MKSTGTEVPPISVLYVDDEPPLLDIGKAFLEQNIGIRVDTEKTATDALHELQKRSYDVIISDYMMPGMNGITFLKTLREKGDTTPFIIFTGRGHEEVAIEAFESGADFYIRKDGDPRSQFTELERKVRKAFNLKRTERESGEMFRLIAENTADLICIHDMNLRPQYISPSVLKMKGFTVDEALAQNAEDIWTPESYAVLHELFQRELALDASGSSKPDRTVFFETEEFCRDGSIILVENSARWIRDDNGSPVGILGISRDITSRRKAEEELRAAYEELMSQEEELRVQYDTLATTEAEWKTTFNAITDWISLLTPNGTILKTNSAVELLLGVPADQVIGMNCFEVVHKTACPVPGCPLQRMVESRRQETALIPKPNGTGWFEVKVDPIIESGGAITGVVHIVRDITEVMRTQKALEQAKKKLNLLNYVTINDLQNMVLTISGYQQIVKATIPDNPALPMMEKQEELILKITNTLDFAESFQNLGLKPARWQDPGHVFLMAISHLDFLRVKHCIELHNLEIFADPLLEKVFVILADNTLKHGESADNVLLYFFEDGESIILVYEDNGPGIPDDLKERIFLPDFQKKKGVGLFLAHEILEITGISICEKGVYGKGARFEIRVPGGSWRRR